MKRTVYLALTLVACEPPAPAPMHDWEQLEALTQAARVQQAEAFAGEVIEVTTPFTLGNGYQAAAEQLREWLESQLPCSTVALTAPPDGYPVVSLHLGTLDDACTFHGRTYAGQIDIRLASIDRQGKVVLEHRWIAVTDGEVTLSGDANVTWNQEDDVLTRHVLVSADWTSAAGTLAVESDLEWRPLSGPDFSDGFVVNGVRDWTDESGRDWSMRADEVAARWVDPIPQSGLLALTNPDNKDAELTFARIDEDTIRVTLTGGESPRLLDVSRYGAVTEVQ